MRESKLLGDKQCSNKTYRVNMTEILATKSETEVNITEILATKSKTEKIFSRDGSEKF